MKTTGFLNGTVDGATQFDCKKTNELKLHLSLIPLKKEVPYSDIDSQDYKIPCITYLGPGKSSRMDSGLQTQSSARVLFGNATNFTRIRDANEFHHYYERPLLVEAWAQTTVEDFDLVDEVHRERNMELQEEVNALREKVRILEEDLRVHVQLLSQIHATAALKTVIPYTETKHSTNAPIPTPPVTPIMQHQQNVQIQHHHHHHNHQQPRRLSPNTAAASTLAKPTVSTYTYGTQIINASQMKIEGPNIVSNTDSIKYTIVAGEENDNNNCEPIEIQLAEEDGALNLNTSADSTRLEICLSADEQTEQNNNGNSIEPETQTVKEEQLRSQSPRLPPLPAQSGMLVKRRKLTSQSEESCHNQETQYYYNGYGSGEPTSTTSVICHSNSNSSTNSYEQPTSTSKLPKNRLSSHNNAEGKVEPGLPFMPSAMPYNETQQHNHNDENVMVSIGPNNTRVPYKTYDSINWENPSIATRKLLMAIFDRQTLATHSMTGKPSPAFKGQSKPQKKRLDPRVTEDIVFVVSRRCKVSDKEVRNAITTKCADENKMMKLQMNKMRSLRDSNKENVTNGTN